MRLTFTKMQGAGNDFVVLDAYGPPGGPIALAPAQWRWLADRRFGIGADQILVVGPPQDAARADFSYRIYNADGGEVEQCGNGARAFARFVRDRGYAATASIRVETMAGIITPTLEADGSVTVDMGAPRFATADVPFDAVGLVPRRVHDESLWPLDVGGSRVEVAVCSMGNPHAVLLVDDVATAPVASFGPLVEHHRRFPRRVNVGFLQIVDRTHVRLRVHERGAGETLACGTGACAAVVSGIRRGLLGATVTVHVRGGELVIGWSGLDAPVTMRGPAETVFEGEVHVPDTVHAIASMDAANPDANPAAAPSPDKPTLEFQPS